MKVGEIDIPITNTSSEIYYTIVVYEDNEYGVSGKDYYYMYKDRIGESVICKATKYTYEDGTYRYGII